MANSEIRCKKSSANDTTSMNQHTRCSFRLNDNHEEDASTQNENVSYLKRNTPILFSTNRGLHLRMSTTTTTLKTNTASTSATNTGSFPTMNSAYSTVFCDLERWSTNRANNISLEDTFTIPKPAVASGSLVSNSLRFLPHKTTSIHFKGYSRFDVE